MIRVLAFVAAVGGRSQVAPGVPSVADAGFPELAVQTYNTAGNWKDLDMIKRARNEAKREGIVIREVDITTIPRDQLDDLRMEMLEILRAPSDGSTIAGKKWTARYAAHRVAWHALDHAWEIEDRSAPAD